MISYDRFWKYIQENNITQYKLMNSGISHSTLTRLKRNESVNMETIDKLCTILECDIEEIVECKRNPITMDED
ncbi:helix-turn-helix transcriptional regulator [Butyrivibrio sp. INlla16]|uniref:helix-turn-helix domain-containing protein n=1 Tax=Butyrivibrio sp. INlla16 TaxID=1520807 RepID=UPI00088AAD71|nr:DNA-binding transcriptional regulator, XRE family [Butyrivibrio sp. INlla16]